MVRPSWDVGALPGWIIAYIAKARQISYFPSNRSAQRDSESAGGCLNGWRATWKGAQFEIVRVRVRHGRGVFIFRPLYLLLKHNISWLRRHFSIRCLCCIWQHQGQNWLEMYFMVKQSDFRSQSDGLRSFRSQTTSDNHDTQIKQKQENEMWVENWRLHQMSDLPGTQSDRWGVISVSLFPGATSMLRLMPPEEKH